MNFEEMKFDKEHGTNGILPVTKDDFDPILFENHWPSRIMSTYRVLLFGKKSIVWEKWGSRPTKRDAASFYGVFRVRRQPCKPPKVSVSIILAIIIISWITHD